MNRGSCSTRLVRAGLGGLVGAPGRTFAEVTWITVAVVLVRYDCSVDECDAV